jgi:hypothetical protein
MAPELKRESNMCAVLWSDGELELK